MSFDFSFPPLPLFPRTPLLLLLFYPRGYIVANLALCFLSPPWAESPGHDTTNPSRIAFLRGRKRVLMFSSIIFNPLPYLFAEGNEKNKKGKEAERELKYCSLHIIGMAWLLASGLWPLKRESFFFTECKFV